MFDSQHQRIMIKKLQNFFLFFHMRIEYLTKFLRIGNSTHQISLHQGEKNKKILKNLPKLISLSQKISKFCFLNLVLFVKLHKFDKYFY